MNAVNDDPFYHVKKIAADAQERIRTLEAELSERVPLAKYDADLAAEVRKRVEVERENERLKRVADIFASRVEYQLNGLLLTMRPECDDSIAGVVEAWDHIRPILKDLREGTGTFPSQIEQERDALKAELAASRLHYGRAIVAQAEASKFMRTAIDALVAAKGEEKYQPPEESK